jgi:hypothetical protein
VIALTVIGSGLSAAPASAFGTPSGPQYLYRMVSITRTAHLAKGKAIGQITCNRTPHSGKTSYTSSTTDTNTFTVQFDVTVAISILFAEIGAHLGITDTQTHGSTLTQAVSVTVVPKECVQLHELRNHYHFTQERLCRYACPGYSQRWYKKGTGTYSRFVGRAYYKVS